MICSSNHKPSLQQTAEHAHLHDHVAEAAKGVPLSCLRWPSSAPRRNRTQGCLFP